MSPFSRTRTNVGSASTALKVFALTAIVISGAIGYLVYTVEQMGEATAQLLSEIPALIAEYDRQISTGLSSRSRVEFEGRTVARLHVLRQVRLSDPRIGHLKIYSGEWVVDDAPEDIRSHDEAVGLLRSHTSADSTAVVELRAAMDSDRTELIGYLWLEPESPFPVYRLPCQTDIPGQWDLVASYGGWGRDTVEFDGATRRLLLRDDGSYQATAPRESVVGSYRVDRQHEPRFGQVQLIEFSRRVEFLGHSSEFIVELDRDSLQLINPWTDSRSHVLVRSPR